MSKAVKGNPQEDKKAQKAFKVIDETFYASNQFKAGNLKNYDMATLKRMSDISRDFAIAQKYITIRLEQSDGAQKAQINKLESQVAALLSPTKTLTVKPKKFKIKKVKITTPAEKPPSTVTTNTASTVVTNV